MTPRLYGTITAHKPGKNFPMRATVSTIGKTTLWNIRYLVDIIQPTLSKNQDKATNSRSFVSRVKTWRIKPDEISCYVTNL